MRNVCTLSMLLLALGCAKGGEGEPDGSTGQPGDAAAPDGRATLGGLGDDCGGQLDCANPLFCVDGVCCSSDVCNGPCRACNVQGFKGTCVPVPAGQDIKDGCGEIDCSGYFSGWMGDSCHTAAAVPAVVAACNGAGQCQGASDLCPAQTDPGPAALTCDSACQTPRTGDTCVGTTPGACNGEGDVLEPNNSCAELSSLEPIVGRGTKTAPTVQLSTIGDNDYFEIVSMGTASDCSGPCTGGQKRYTVHLYLRNLLPAGGGSYNLRSGLACGADTDLQVAAPGSLAYAAWQFGPVACSAAPTNRVFVRVDGSAVACTPYELLYEVGTSCP